MPAGYRIRGRRPIDDAALLGIENRAAQLFRHHGYPAHGRRGLGAALVKAVLAAAVEHGCAGVSLTTFRFVAFNRPFYQRLGFAELSLDAAPSVLRDAFARELPQGIDMKERLLMLRCIGDPVAGELTS